MTEDREGLAVERITFDQFKQEIMHPGSVQGTPTGEVAFPVKEHEPTPETKRVRQAAKEFWEAIAEEKIIGENITDHSQQMEVRKEIRREIEDCHKRIHNLPYANLEEQSAVLSMLTEHTYMQIRKFRDDSVNIEEINWLVNEMQDGIQKLTETVDRIIKYEHRRDK